MSIEFFPSSEKASVMKMELPFESLEVGMSFTVPFNIVENNLNCSKAFEGGLRNKVSSANKHSDKKFRCIKHKSLMLFEIARVR